MEEEFLDYIVTRNDVFADMQYPLFDGHSPMFVDYNRRVCARLFDVFEDKWVNIMFDVYKDDVTWNESKKMWEIKYMSCLNLSDYAFTVEISNKTNQGVTLSFVDFIYE